MRELALPPVKIHCSVLAEDAIKAAIGDWKKKHGIEVAGRSKSRALRTTAYWRGPARSCSRVLAQVAGCARNRERDLLWPQN